MNFFFTICVPVSYW